MKDVKDALCKEYVEYTIYNLYMTLFDIVYVVCIVQIYFLSIMSSTTSLIHRGVSKSRCVHRMLEPLAFGPTLLPASYPLVM